MSNTPRSHRLAVIITEALAPVVVAYLVCIAVALGTTEPLIRALLIGVVAATLAAGIPYALVVVRSHRGTLSGRHVPNRAERPLILGLAALSALAAVPITAALGADREVGVLLAAAVTGLVVAAIISRFWKLSIHVAGAAGAVVVVALVFGPAWLALTLLVIGLGWARTYLGAHDVAQVVGGAAIGAGVTLIVSVALGGG